MLIPWVGLMTAFAPTILQEYIMNKLQKQLEKLASEKQLLQRERTDLQRQCSEMTVAVEKLNKEKVGTCFMCWFAELLVVRGSSR